MTPTKLTDDNCETKTTMVEGEIHEGKEKLKKLNGYWIWWCYTHDRPFAWCEKERAIKETNTHWQQRVEDAIEKGIKKGRKMGAKNFGYVLALVDLKSRLLGKENDEE